MCSSSSNMLCYSNELFVIEQGWYLFRELICKTNYKLHIGPTLITTTIELNSGSQLGIIKSQILSFIDINFVMA